MSGVDNRIVSMEFDNEAFERKLSATLASLDKLSDSLRFAGAENGFNTVAAAADKFDTSHMSAALDNISSKFSALGAVGFTVIQSLTRGMLDLASHAADLAKINVIDPILGGGKQRAQNIEQAKFLFRGLGLNVEEGMASALAAVKDTSFGLDEAAKAAAQFGASGLKIGPEMTGALRAIAGAAALTGTTFSEMGDIFTSSAASGVVNNQDLLQFATRGLNAAAAVGKQLGITEVQVHKMATEGKLDFKTFADAMDKAFGAHAKKANETYAGSLANLHAAMSRLGASILGPRMEQQRVIFNALTPVIDNVSAALQPLIKAFLGLSQIGTDKIVKFLQNLDLSNFKLAVPNFAEGIKAGFAGVTKFLDVIRGAFRDVFPPSASSKLLAFSEAFKHFTEKLALTEPVIAQLKGVFRGFFSIIEIGWTILKEIALLIGSALQAIFPAKGTILGLAEAAGSMATNLNKTLVIGGGIHAFFVRLREVIVVAITAVVDFTNKIVSFFQSVSKSSAAKDTEDTVGRIGQRFENLASIPDRVSASWARLHDRFQGVFDILDKVGNGIKTWFGELGSKIADAFKPGDFNNALDIINVGLLGGITLMLKRFISKGFKEDFGSGFVKKLLEPLDALTQKLRAMTTNIKADTLLKIAEAIGILTISLVALSLIDSAALTKALVAMTVGFGELVGVMSLLDKVIGSVGSAAKLTILGVALIEIAAAMAILAVAIKVLSDLSWGELVTGLTGVAVGLGLLVLATNLITADTAGLVAAGVAMIAISTGLLILSEAVKSFADMPFGDMIKGLAGVAIGLGLITLAMRAMPAKSLLSGIGFIEVAAGLLILSQAVKLFGELSLAEMVKGLIGIAGALFIIVAAMKLMPLTLPITAAGLLILSVALNAMAVAVRVIGGMDFGSLLKGLGGLAAMLLILVVAMHSMQSAILGAASLVIVAGALLVLTVVLKTLGSLSLAQLAIGLGAIAAVLLLLGGAAILLTPVIPLMLALGAALVTMGKGFALFGIGALLVVKALELLSKVGKAGAQAIVDIIKIFITAKVEIVKALAAVIIGFIKSILDAVPLLLRLVEAVLLQFLETVIKLAPKFAQAFIVVIGSALKSIRTLFPDILETGAQILITLLKGIRDHINEIVTVGTDLIINFATSLVNNMPRLVAAAVQLIQSFLGELANHAVELVASGVNLLVNFLLGISQEVGRIVAAVTLLIEAFVAAVASHVIEIVTAGTNILIALVQGIADNISKIITAATDILIAFVTTLANNQQKLIDAGVNLLLQFIGGIIANVTKIVEVVGTLMTTFITAVGNKATDLAGAGANALVKFLDGFGSDLKKVVDKGTEIAGKLLEGAASDAVGFANKAGDVLVKFLNGMAEAIRTHNDELRDAGINIAGAIADGLTGGLASKAGDAVNAGKSLGGKVLDGIKAIGNIFSPSKETFKLGEFMAAGLVLAFDKDTSVEASAENLGERMLTKIQETLAQIPDSIGEIDNFSPVITPVLDLTKVKSASSVIDSLMKISTITPEVSFDKATIISTTAELDSSSSDTPTAPTSSEVNFEQNIYAPTALSTNDIYRNTKSQIALAKEELNIG